MKRILIGPYFIWMISICLASEYSDSLMNIHKRSKNDENLKQIMCDTRMASINFKCSLEYRKLDLKNDIKVSKTEIMCENRLIDVKRKCADIGQRKCLEETEQLDEWCKDRFSEIKRIHKKSYKYIGEVCSNAVKELGRSCFPKKVELDKKSDIVESSESVVSVEPVQTVESVETVVSVEPAETVETVETVSNPIISNETIEETITIDGEPGNSKMITTKPEVQKPLPGKTELSKEKLEKIEWFTEKPIKSKVLMDIFDQIKPFTEKPEKPEHSTEKPMHLGLSVNEWENIKLTGESEQSSDRDKHLGLSVNDLEKIKLGGAKPEASEQSSDRHKHLGLSVNDLEKIRQAGFKPEESEQTVYDFQLSFNDLEKIRLGEAKHEESEQSSDRHKHLGLSVNDLEKIRLGGAKPEESEQSSDRHKHLGLSVNDLEKIRLGGAKPEESEQSTETHKHSRLYGDDSETIRLTEVKPVEVEQSIETDGKPKLSVDRFKERKPFSEKPDRPSKDQTVITGEEGFPKRSKTQVDITYIFGESQHDIPRRELIDFMNYLGEVQKRESDIKTIINYIFGENQYKMKKADLELFIEMLKEMEQGFEQQNYKLLTPDLTNMSFSSETVKPVQYSSLSPGKKVTVKLNIEKLIVFVFGGIQNQIQNSDMSNFLQRYLKSGRLNLMVPIKNVIKGSLWQKSGLVAVPNTESIIKFIFGSNVPKVERIDLMRFIDKVADKRPYNIYFSAPLSIPRYSKPKVDALVNYMFERVKHKLLKHGLGVIQNKDFSKNQKSNIQTLINYMLERYKHKIEKHNMLSLISPMYKQRQHTSRQDFQVMLSKIFENHINNLFPTSRVKPYKIGVLGWRQYSLNPGLYKNGRKDKAKYIKRPIVVKPNILDSSKIFKEINDLVSKPDSVSPVILKPSQYKIQTVVDVQPQTAPPQVPIIKPAPYKIQTILGIEQPPAVEPVATPKKPADISDNVNLVFYVIDSLVEEKPVKPKPLLKPVAVNRAKFRTLLASPILKKNPLNVSFVFEILDELVNPDIPDESSNPDDSENELLDKDTDDTIDTDDSIDAANSMYEIFKGKFDEEKPKPPMEFSDNEIQEQKPPLAYSVNVVQDQKPLLASPQRTGLLEMVDEIEIEDPKPEEVIGQTIEPFIEYSTPKPTDRKVRMTTPNLPNIKDSIKPPASYVQEIKNLTIETIDVTVEVVDINGTTTVLNMTIDGSNILDSNLNTTQQANKNVRSTKPKKSVSKLTTRPSKIQVTTENSKVINGNSKVTTKSFKVMKGNSKGTTGNPKLKIKSSKSPTGNPKGATGNPKGSTGNHKGSTGNHKVTTESHEGTTGNHKGTTGNHKGTTGNHKGTTKSSKPSTGNPKGTTENPKGATGSPKGATGSPKGTASNPKGVTGNPKVTTGNPKVTTGKSKGTTGNPKVTMGNPKVTTESFKETTRTLKMTSMKIKTPNKVTTDNDFIINEMQRTSPNLKVGKSTKKGETSKQISGEPNQSTKNPKTTAKIEITTKT